MAPAPLRLAIVTPVFNDWPSFATLAKALDALAGGWNAKVTLIAVDDGSTQSAAELAKTENIESVEIVTLACNVGHQRAIAVGLAEVAHRDAFDAVVVLDSDGEDKPEDIARLLDAHRANPSAAIGATRSKRSEGIAFRAFYVAYKLTFERLTGKAIDFGNFSLLPARALERIVFMPETWNHLAAAIVRSRVAIVRVPTQRGTRYAGRSSMGFVSLIAHGLGAISVFADVLFVRMLMACGVLFVIALAFAIVTIVLHATLPEWTLTVSWIVTATFALGTLVSAAFAFTTLSNRSTRAFIPAEHARRYIRSK